MSHIVTQIFSLVDREIILHKPHHLYSRGWITNQMGMWFNCILKKTDGKYTYQCINVILHRSEFILPPMSQEFGRGIRLILLPDDSDGFAYADVPNF